MVLDVMLPNMNGFDVLRSVRESNQLPILMLTARGDDIDRVVGLEMGADDYLTKPCNPRELVARIRSIIRRFEMVPKSKQLESSSFIQLLDVSVNLHSREVSVEGNLLELTGTEFEILTLLVKKQGRLVTRELISETCLGRKLVAYDRSIDMHVSNIRKKLGTYSSSNEHIKTIRGTGYQYVAV
jgi:two-component system response regulator CpxR